MGPIDLLLMISDFYWYYHGNYWWLLLIIQYKNWFDDLYANGKITSMRLAFNSWIIVKRLWFVNCFTQLRCCQSYCQSLLYFTWATFLLVKICQVCPILFPLFQLLIIATMITSVEESSPSPRLATSPKTSSVLYDHSSPIFFYIDYIY